ncbi:hypothetical protein FQN55_001247 [Onygenales sp. PD_40]|nr:hypothetical protein FQN55_001247 [Onygenales sp. PD_40]KAK2790419.1 hypothetical protein FQN53_009442 [Emmonsiellopsis sp. PD_33]
MPADTPYFQTTIPHAALRRSYVMNSILAAAAVDLAVSAVEGPQAEKYYYMALKYGTQASAGFRTELENINEENLHILYHISALLAVWNYTMAGRHGSTLDRMHVIFDMFFGAATIAWTNPKWLTSVPSSSRDAIYLKPLTMDVVDANTLTALGYLATVSRQIHVRPIRTPIAMFNLEFETEGPLLASEAYRIPIAQLRYSFAEDAVDRIKGYVMSLITVGGPEFVAAVKAHEPMALFMLMYFGVLVNRSSSQETRWWLGTAGRDIVSEISDILENSPIARIPEGRLGMSWTREQVGLPPLADVGLGQSFCSLTEIESLFLT